MNIAIPNRRVERTIQYIASIRYSHAHKCSGIVNSQDYVLVIPTCFYGNDELVGKLHLYEVWIGIPYKGLSGRYSKIAEINVSIRFKHGIEVLLVCHYTKNVIL